MRRELHGWHSPILNKHMEIVIYGDYGDALLMFPTAAADYLEYERFLLVDAISNVINKGKFKVFSINSINAESWLNNDMHPRHKAIRHKQFNEYIVNEVVPFIKKHTSQATPIFTTGASLGALHAANNFFRRPDIFAGTIAMSGDYNLSSYTKGYYDEDVYFNSPEQYLAKMEDHNMLEEIRKSPHIHIMTGSGNYEKPEASQTLSHILNAKSIPHELDIWGPDMGHDWPTWRAMLPYYLESRF